MLGVLIFHLTSYTASYLSVHFLTLQKVSLWVYNLIHKGQVSIECASGLNTMTIFPVLFLHTIRQGARVDARFNSS